MSDVNLEGLVKLFNLKFSEKLIKSYSFTIKGTGMFATKTSSGNYTNSTLFDGDKLGFGSAYLNKQNKINFVFVAKSPMVNYKFVEMSLDDAILSLSDDFKNLVESIAKNGFSEESPQINLTYEAKHAPKNKNLKNLNWGVW